MVVKFGSIFGVVLFWWVMFASVMSWLLAKAQCDSIGAWFCCCVEVPAMDENVAIPSCVLSVAIISFTCHHLIHHRRFTACFFTVSMHARVGRLPSTHDTRLLGLALMGIWSRRQFYRLLKFQVYVVNDVHLSVFIKTAWISRTRKSAGGRKANDQCTCRTAKAVAQSLYTVPEH